MKRVSLNPFLFIQKRKKRCWACG